MKYFLSDIIPRLKKFSATLDQSAFLVDKPWVVSNGSGSLDKLIFRRDGRVHLSSDGTVRDGTWEYLPEAQSLLIDYGDIKKLYRHQYLDQAVLALKQDGFSSDDAYFLLANENVIPDCDAKKYLRDKYFAENNIEIKLLENGEEIVVESPRDSAYQRALINGVRVPDGNYLVKGNRERIIVENGNIVKTIWKTDYPGEIVIWQANYDPSRGDLVDGFTDGSLVIKSHIKYKLEVKDGRVSKAVNITERNIILFMIIFILLLIILWVFNLLVI